jgi:hypothetical protein
VEDACGIFVSIKLGNDSNMGSKGSPVATIGHAILEANGTNRPIYVCNEAFTEVVEAPAGVELYGGLDCANGWTWSEAGRTTLTAASDSVPLKLTSGTAVTRVENFAVTAADATQPGGSSIAAIIDNVPAEIAHCDFTAAKARDGADGMAEMTAAMDGMAGQPGTAACDPAASVMGGAGGMLTCDGASTQGGNGGSGGIPGMDSGNGQTGASGQPGGTAGGTGQIDVASVCMIGQTGMDGQPGALGTGGMEIGSLSISGISGGNGQNGETGTPGQGGGGGGGARSGVFCGGVAEGAGASGGGGGSGGCGGKGGAGGQAGGSSIALISSNAALTLNQVTLTSGAGGKGGTGATAQPGGQPGAGGAGGAKKLNPSKPGCDGGKGGYGGEGGPGGGGRGGHSLGFAFRGTPPPAEGYTITPGTPGDGGVGATMDPAGAGAIGVASPTPVEFP